MLILCEVVHVDEACSISFLDCCMATLIAILC